MQAHKDDKASDWAAAWKNSPEASSISKDIDSLVQSQVPLAELADGSKGSFNASTAEQSWLLTKRIFRNQWRNVSYLYSKIWVHVVSAILVGFTLFQVGTSPTDLQNRVFAVFFMLFLVNAIVNTILVRFFFERLFWEAREGPTRTYGWVALCNASILAELPGALICGVVYYILFYFPAGLPLGQSAGYNFLVILTYEIFQVCALLPFLFTAVQRPSELTALDTGFAWPVHHGCYT